MAKKEKQQKKKKGQSVQDMMGIQTFTKYGLLTDKGELLFYMDLLSVIKPAKDHHCRGNDQRCLPNGYTDRLCHPLP